MAGPCAGAPDTRPGPKLWSPAALGHSDHILDTPLPRPSESTGPGPAHRPPPGVRTSRFPLLTTLTPSPGLGPPALHLDRHRPTAGPSLRPDSSAPKEMPGHPSRPRTLSRPHPPLWGPPHQTTSALRSLPSTPGPDPLHSSTLATLLTPMIVRTHSQRRPKPSLSSTLHSPMAETPVLDLLDRGGWEKGAPGGPRGGAAGRVLQRSPGRGCCTPRGGWCPGGLG